ncbi:uncharacterized protein LOC102712593 isoform X2 [Oryza brachyantha]|uniref:uncharacterized protein LOC102712593 isoform X2 n=1 Tax=Oryza brachyantha TaxID=4533 RepID=UPI001ADCE3F8|nr:uncharacterized protein LOC102712593 isoform X2 [Oryza brachyantha]
MPTQRSPHLTSRRHAELLRHLLQDGGAAVKDLRLRRVVPLASAPLYDSSLDGAAAKPGSAEATPGPPEAQDRERKPAAVVQRSKLVRAPSSFGYRRLLPFLNELTNQESESPPGKDNTKTEEFRTSPFHSVDADSEAEAEACPVKEEINTVPAHLPSSKMCLSRCQSSRFVHHPSSFSYKRMLPFLIENDISSQEGHRTKIPRLVQEKQSSTDEDDKILTSIQHHFTMSGSSADECKTAQGKRSVEEQQSRLGVAYLPDGSLLQPAVSEASHLQASTVEVRKLAEERVVASDVYLLSSDKGEFTLKWNDGLPAGLHQFAVSEDFPEESNKTEVETILEENESVPDGNSVLDGGQLHVYDSKASPPEGTAQMQKATQKQTVTSDGDEGNTLPSCKHGFLAKEQPLHVIEELPIKGNAECYEVQQSQSSELGSSDVCFGGPTKVVIPSGNCHGALEQSDSMVSLDEPLLDAEMTCIPLHPCATGAPVPYSVEEAPAGVLYTSDHCSTGAPLSSEEITVSSSVVYNEPASIKVSPLRQRGAPCLEKRCLSPKKLSPKKGILKRNTRGCKGICMCLDCSTFRLRADRAFEFSRKQMQEADDIIDNLLKEVSSLRNLMEKSAGQFG